MTDLDSTMNRALADCERESIEAAQKAFARGDIAQVEVGPGIWRLVQCVS